MTHEELVRDLALHLRIPAGTTGTCRWVTMHASLGSQWLERGCPQADVLTVRGSHTKQEVAIYEGKVSRSDWTKELRSGKWEHYLPFCHRMYFACPAGLVSKDELPAGTGLIVRGGGGWQVVVSAPRRPDNEVVWDQAAYSLMCGLLFSIGNQETTIRDQELRVRRLKQDVAWYSDYKRLRRELGDEVARRLAIAQKLDQGHDVLARIQALESNMRGAARTLGISAEHAGVGDALPQWNEWSLGSRLRAAATADLAIERGCWLLAANNTCPPAVDWPVEVAADRLSSMLLQCAGCRSAHCDHIRRECWRAWLGALTPQQWANYVRNSQLLQAE